MKNKIQIAIIIMILIIFGIDLLGDYHKIDIILLWFVVVLYCLKDIVKE